ncbi:MAG TPA: efflux transporter outer membrane subunit [Alphaproteobacteria bacterium]|nr:efflux transporter outer membrane subunit [Alphaproteobacteria bacterium]
MNKTLILALALFLPACSAGPDYQTPQNSFFDGWFSSAADISSQDPINVKWWEVFQDPLLTKYIEQSAQNNKDVQIALANIKKARAQRRESTGALLPSVGSDAQATRSKSSSAGSSSTNSGQIRNVYDAGFDASWELDLFGGTRRGVEAADARIGAAVASYQDVMLTTFAEVARTYYEARGSQKRIAITQQNADLLKQTYELIEKRVSVGEASQFDLTRARGEYQSTLARLPNLQADMETSVFSLSVLLGLPPEALLEEMKDVQPLPTPPDIVPVGLRSDILRRRPDIRIAERELAASSADIGVETAELFPKFFITGDIGTQARLFSDLFTAAAGFWSLGSVMQWSVFEGGAIQARIDSAKAENEAALKTYEKTVLEALGDVETALTRYGREIETRQRLQESVASRREAVSLAQQLLDVGESDYLDVLDAQRELTSGEDSLVVSETATVTKLIALYTALGGGWEAVNP